MFFGFDTPVGFMLCIVEFGKQTKEGSSNGSIFWISFKARLPRVAPLLAAINYQNKFRALSSTTRGIYITIERRKSHYASDNPIRSKERAVHTKQHRASVRCLSLPHPRQKRRRFSGLLLHYPPVSVFYFFKMHRNIKQWHSQRPHVPPVLVTGTPLRLRCFGHPRFQPAYDFARNSMQFTSFYSPFIPHDSQAQNTRFFTALTAFFLTILNNHNYSSSLNISWRL